MFVSLDFPEQQRSSSYFLEIDLGTEAPVRLREKVTGYWRAVEASTDDFFPYVVFVVRQQVRKNEIGRILRGLPEEQQEIVRVALIGDLIPQLMKL